MSVKELILQQKQLSYEKEDALFCILANFQDQNCNKKQQKLALNIWTIEVG